MKARIPKHREFIINFPDSIDNAKANEGWAKLQQIVEGLQESPQRRFRLRPHLHRGLRSPRSRSCRKSTASSTPSSTFSNFSRLKQQNALRQK